MDGLAGRAATQLQRRLPPEPLEPLLAEPGGPARVRQPGEGQNPRRLEPLHLARPEYPAGARGFLHPPGTRAERAHCRPAIQAYTLRVIRRTSLNLDFDLVAAAREVLGTQTTTDTVHTALRDVVRQERLRRLAEWKFEDLTPEALKELRRTRTDRWAEHGPNV